MLLRLDGLSVRFGGVEALAGVDLRLEPGQVLGLLGANGCGKTTLFNTISGVVRADAGRIVFLDHDITAAPIHDIARRGVARTFQTVRLFPAMTVADNVARVDEAGGLDSVEHALELAGLAGRRHVLAAELSLAEQRRLEIARALARSPQLVLMDEPTSGLSRQETEDMIGLLADTVLPNRAVIVSEHKPHVLAALCPSAALLDQGHKLMEGPARASLRQRRLSQRVSGVYGKAGHRTRMPAMKHTIMLILVIAALVAPARAADRAHAAIDCKATAEKFVYDCTIKLTNARTAAPLEQAVVSVGADMPSMPMAHNVRPVTAKATDAPGEYQARLGLEMYGDWAVRLKIAGPLRDQLVEMKNFSEAGSGPPSRKAGPPRGGHRH